jgi:rubrerythrin
MDRFSSVNDILDFAINAEQEAVDFYQRLSAQTDNAEMSNVFLQFAKEEMGHKARLLRLKEERTFDISHEAVPDLKIADYLVDVEARPDMTYRDALIVAMKKEKSAFRLYMNLADKVSSAGLKEVFISLAVEESKHKLRFEIEYDDFVMREN